MPVKMLITAGTAADCNHALPLIEGINADYLFADRAYDTNEILAYLEQQQMEPVIPESEKP